MGGTATRGCDCVPLLSVMDCKIEEPRRSRPVTRVFGCIVYLFNPLAHTLNGLNGVSNKRDTNTSKSMRCAIQTAGSRDCKVRAALCNKTDTISLYIINSGSAAKLAQIVFS
ncbi:unnamed protein product [Sphagnum jensenii]|uniref:Uncharacterized protein n=1 Tax=Sphagnum jensenii TaxID=128206 RepID=A0ABP0VCJ3_9BRYO